jgi:hypothetical protein
MVDFEIGLIIMLLLDLLRRFYPDNVFLNSLNLSIIPMEIILFRGKEKLLDEL